MKIKLNKAIDLLNSSAAVIVASDSNMPVIYASIDDEVRLVCDIDGDECNILINFDDNETVGISKDCLIFKDEKGEDVALKLLFPSQLSSFCGEGDII